MKKFLRHFFLPHHTNNHRAKLLHHETMLILIGILFVGSIAVGSFRQSHPQVLGVSINMSINDLLLLTNVARQQNGLPVLQLNGALNAAAANKAANMFAENYWAHFSPSGKSPWDFIRGAGYNYVYAGENLARGFTTAQDTVNAWMNSPDHRANVLSPNYTDVGFAIAQGSLTGESDTVLVVEEFGSQSFAKPQLTPSAQTVAAAQNNQPVPTATPFPTPIITPIALATPPVLGQQGFEALSQLRQAPLINAAFWAKALTFGLLGIFIFTFLLDFVVIGKKQMVRIVGHNIDHILFLLGILVIAYFIGQGIIS